MWPECCTGHSTIASKSVTKCPRPIHLDHTSEKNCNAAAHIPVKIQALPYKVIQMTGAIIQCGRCIEGQMYLFVARFLIIIIIIIISFKFQFPTAPAVPRAPSGLATTSFSSFSRHEAMDTDTRSACPPRKRLDGHGDQWPPQLPGRPQKIEPTVEKCGVQKNDFVDWLIVVWQLEHFWHQKLGHWNIDHVCMCIYIYIQQPSFLSLARRVGCCWFCTWQTETPVH